jgi:YVTN family beta-propeller protein
VKKRTKNRIDIRLGSATSLFGVAITPDGKTAFVAKGFSVPLGGTMSTIDVKTRTTNHPTDISGGTGPGVAITPDGKTVFVNNAGMDTVSTIDVKTRTKQHADIPVGEEPGEVAVTPDGKTAFVTN